MPNLEHELSKLSRSRCYATFYLSHGYWQFELDGDSQPLQSFITPDEVLLLTRVLHGTTNAVRHLQSSLTQVLPESISRNLLSWLDDFLLRQETANGLLQVVEKFLTFCTE